MLFRSEVLKIELPESGDPMRTLGDYPPEGDSSYWWSAIGRNKRSIALDVRTEAGRNILGRLLEKLSGLSYAQLVQREVLAKCGITSMRIAGNTLAQRAKDEVV